MSRFPKISETFILYEILELRKLGLDVEIFPLVHHREPVKHLEAEALAQHTHYHHLLSWAVLAAQFFWLRRQPIAYLGAWWGAIRGNLWSPRFLSRAFAVVPLAASFARQMQALGVTHVHAHWATHPTLAAYVIRQLTGLPYSFTAHSHDIQANRTMLAEKIRRARFVVTISEHNRNFIGALYGPTAAGKVTVVHCGIDPEVFQPRQDRKPNATLTIACVARLEEIKGHPYLIEACAYLKDRGIPFHCWLIGDGLTRPQLNAQIAHLKLENHVSLLGSQPQHQVRELLAGADVIVLPSITHKGRKEGIPVSLMEALAMELPAVSTAGSAIPELIEDGIAGLIVPERDARALAEALIKIYTQPEQSRQFGKAGREKVLREFNLHRNARMLSELFLHHPDSKNAVPAQNFPAIAVAPEQKYDS